MSNNSIFEGLFVRNRPFGPGILTHPNGRQDVGFWLGSKLVRLSRSVDFIVPRLAPTVTAKIKLLQYKQLLPLPEKSCESDCKLGAEFVNYLPRSPYSRLIYDPRSIFFDKDAFAMNFPTVCKNVVNFTNERKESDRNATDNGPLINGSRNVMCEQLVCGDDVFFMRDQKFFSGNLPFNTGILTYFTKFGNFDDLEDELPEGNISDFGYDEGSEIMVVKGVMNEKECNSLIVSWNRGELCTEIVKQIYRHRAYEDRLNFKIAELMSGARTAFRKTGLREKECLYFLKMCSLGPPYIIKELLCDSEISEELMDSRGNNGLMFAAVSDQLEIIDILSDFGVDVNAFNDESLTPLNICLLRRLAAQNETCNWETAFLAPQEEKSEDPKEEYNEMLKAESIGSMDRKFGDGMSISDEKKFLTMNEIQPSIPNERISTSDKIENDDMASQVTVLNFQNATEQNEYSTTTRTVDASLLPGNNNPTFDAKHIAAPKSNKTSEFQKSIAKCDNDKYLLGLHLSEIQKPVTKERKETGKEDKGKKEQLQLQPIEPEPEEPSPEIKQLLSKIDATIEKLLQRGADPNLSDVPKPSIHLGVFTQDPGTVECLLRYGADSNHQLNINEGLLTPMHVLALLKPRLNAVEILEVLLKYGANPEMETHPDFSMQEDETSYLSELHGRTPLQLLCMRPDIEYGDLFGYVINLGIKLAKVSNKKHYFNGHSGLTLAMLWGNTRLLDAFLRANCFDPNEILGEGLGTPLHVLVSTQLQRRTPYDVSIKMCDILLDAGADPDMILELPTNIFGTCVDYGFREIEIEKGNRKLQQKMTGKTEKNGSRDQVKDHIRVVEYLAKRRQQKSLNLLNEQTDGINGPPTKGQQDGSMNIGVTTRSEIASSMLERIKFDDQSKMATEEPVSITLLKRLEMSPKTGKGQTDRNKKGAKAKASQSNKNVEKPKIFDGGSKTSDLSKSLTEKEPKIPCSQILLDALLKMLGECKSLDVDQFALPYVVLRDGNFYYKFHGSMRIVREKEQYSLI